MPLLAVPACSSDSVTTNVTVIADVIEFGYEYVVIVGFDNVVSAITTFAGTFDVFQVKTGGMIVVPTSNKPDGELEVNDVIVIFSYQTLLAIFSKAAKTLVVVDKLALVLSRITPLALTVSPFSFSRASLALFEAVLAVASVESS